MRERERERVEVLGKENVQEELKWHKSDIYNYCTKRLSPFTLEWLLGCVPFSRGLTLDPWYQ